MGYLYIADINSAARDSGAPIVSSEATTLSPQLAARASGALFAGDFFGILQHFDYTQGQQQDIYQARGVSRVSVLPKTVYLDMYGALEQRSIDSDPLVEQNRFQLSERRSDVYSLSATPTVALHGARTYTELKYTREMSRVRASNVGDYDGNQFQASIASANTEVNQASWKSFALWRDTAFRDRGESKSRDLGGNYRFNLSSVVELDLTGGGEYNLQPYVSTVRNDYQFYW
ncbi:MAG: hypothetical protein OEW08_12870, partial [Gammaproteobacteria bacterium]|nr:hypothetical protein [Gammaproteobacteria bacterium]